MRVFLLMTGNKVANLTFYVSFLDCCTGDAVLSSYPVIRYLVMVHSKQTLHRTECKERDASNKTEEAV